MWSPAAEVAKRVEAQASFGFGRVELIRRVWDEPIDVVGAANEHRLEFAMLPRSGAARGCFPDRWGTQQFEPFGEIFFFPAGQIIHAQSQCRQQYSVVCSFRPQAAEVCFDGRLQWTDARLHASLNITNPSIRSLLHRLGEELRNPRFAGTALIEMMAGQLSIELARYFMNIQEPRTGGLSPRSLRLIEERLAENGAPPGLAELASLCGLSVRHLTRAFRTSRRRSIGDYIAESRIQRAKHLLASGLSVKSIAYTTGFSSPEAFSTAFRRATGERPRDYLQRVGQRGAGSEQPAPSAKRAQHG